MHLSSVPNAVFGSPTLHSLNAVLEFTPTTTDAREVDEEEHVKVERAGMGVEDTASWLMRQMNVWRDEEEKEKRATAAKNQAMKRSFLAAFGTKSEPKTKPRPNPKLEPSSGSTPPVANTAIETATVPAAAPATANAGLSSSSSPAEAKGSEVIEVSKPREGAIEMDVEPTVEPSEDVMSAVTGSGDGDAATSGDVDGDAALSGESDAAKGVDAEDEQTEKDEGKEEDGIECNHCTCVGKDEAIEEPLWQVILDFKISTHDTEEPSMEIWARRRTSRGSKLFPHNDAKLLLNVRGGCMHNEIIEKMYAQQWQTLHPQVHHICGKGP